MSALKIRSKRELAVIILAGVAAMMFFLPIVSFSYEGSEESLSWLDTVTGTTFFEATMEGQPLHIVMLLMPVAIVVVTCFVKAPKPKGIINAIIAGIYALICSYFVVVIDEMGEELAATTTVFCSISIYSGLAILVLSIIGLVKSRKGAPKTSTPKTSTPKISAPEIPGARRAPTATSAKTVCSHCGAKLPNDAKFCTNCGCPIEAAAE